MRISFSKEKNLSIKYRGIILDEKRVKMSQMVGVAGFEPTTSTTPR